jgi:hypothetical protein
MAIGEGASRNDASRSLNSVLKDNNHNVRFAAYESMSGLNSFAISRKLIGSNFFLDTIISPGDKAIYVTRNGFPKIVLFSSPFDCNENIFAKSDDGTVVINGSPGKKFVSIMRKHPTRPELIGPFSSSYSVASIIRTLGAKTIQPENSRNRPGLGVPYSEIIMLLERMCSEGMIKARFDASPMTIVKPINPQPIPSGN